MKRIVALNKMEIKNSHHILRWPLNSLGHCGHQTLVQVRYVSPSMIRKKFLHFLIGSLNHFVNFILVLNDSAVPIQTTIK